MTKVEQLIVNRLRSLRQLLRDEGYPTDYNAAFIGDDYVSINNAHWELSSSKLDLYVYDGKHKVMTAAEKRIIYRLKSLRQLLKKEGYPTEYACIFLNDDHVRINNKYWLEGVKGLDVAVYDQ